MIIIIKKKTRALTPSATKATITTIIRCHMDVHCRIWHMLDKKVQLKLENVDFQQKTRGKPDWSIMVMICYYQSPIFWQCCKHWYRRCTWGWNPKEPKPPSGWDPHVRQTALGMRLLSISCFLNFNQQSKNFN